MKPIPPQESGVAGKSAPQVGQTLFLFLLMFVVSLEPRAGARDARGSETDGAPTSAGEAADLFPDKARLRFARCFTIDYHGTYKRVEVRDAWRNARESFEYILVPRSQATPPDLPGEATVVFVPVERIAVFSTSWTAFFPMLHIEESLVGLAGSELVSTPEVVSRIRKGAIEEIGDGGSGMNRKIHLERLTLVRPEAVMVYATGIPDFDQHPKLMEAGFKTIVNASHMEATPLGRTEWIKLIAAFFNREAEAERLFDEIALRYEALVEKTRNVSHRPTVFCNAAGRGTWIMPGGAGYTARFLDDAGAHYLWREDPSAGTIPLAIETVVDRAREAEYWVDTNLFRSMAELKGVDERFSLFASFRSGNVFNNDAKISAKGGNDFWETGMARPDLVLADLISIFHPELVPGHQRIWYRQLPAVAEEFP
jgi:iron complex transport system substrate-binding protein